MTSTEKLLVDAFIEAIEKNSGSTFLNVVAEYETLLDEGLNSDFSQFLKAEGISNTDRENSKQNILVIMACARIMRKRLRSLIAWTNNVKPPS